MEILEFDKRQMITKYPYLEITIDKSASIGETGQVQLNSLCFLSKTSDRLAVKCK